MQLRCGLLPNFLSTGQNVSATENKYCELEFTKTTRRLTVVGEAAAAYACALEAREAATLEFAQNDQYDNGSDYQHTDDHDQRYLP